MKIKKYICLVFLLCVLCVSNIYYKDEVNSIDGIEELERGDTDSPVHTEYDGIALALIISQGVLIGGAVIGYLIYKKKKEEKEKQKQNTSSTSNQIVFYSSYDTVKNEEPKTEVASETKTETTPVFTSSSTFSTSNIVNGPTQNTSNINSTDTNVNTNNNITN